MAPERPGDFCQLRMAGLGGEIAQSPEEGLVRPAPRVEPEFRAGGAHVAIVQHMIARAEQGAVPLLGQGLPMQVVGGGGAFLGGRHARAVLVDDDAAEGLHAVRNPEGVGDGKYHFARDSGRRIIQRQILSGSAYRSRPAKNSNGEQGQSHELGSHQRARTGSAWGAHAPSFHSCFQSCHDYFTGVNT
jgi:hypothetical protein